MGEFKTCPEFLTHRNSLIVAARQKGMQVKAIAQDFKLTPTRVCQILSAAQRLKPREEV